MLDLGVLSVAYALAFGFRFGLDIHLQQAKLLFFTLPYVVLFQYLVLAVCGVPAMAWRYVSIREAVRILQAISFTILVLAAVHLVLAGFGGHSRFVVIPFGVLAMDFALALLGLVGVRALVRICNEAMRGDGSKKPKERRKTILIGAGQAGVLVAKEVATWGVLGIDPVGFVDDDPVKTGRTVHGLEVLGTIADLPKVCRDTGADQALIAIANSSGRVIRRIRDICQDAGVETKIIPGLFEIVGGKVNLQRIRNVAIDDLLGREPVELDERLIAAKLKNRSVLVTGAGGSIGSELCRQVCRFEPSELILVEQAENSLFHIHSELTAAAPEIKLVPYIADICDQGRIEQILASHRPVAVFHAAAHKHVPMMEWNSGEAIKNNVLGTKLVADLAGRFGVERFIMISTDKAVNPTSVMGASKRVAEMYVQALSTSSQTAFVTVRFGNVLGSAGSVVPLFKQQIAAGGPVTVTDPEMRRYFMTIPEASQLVLQAGAMGDGGEIFVLDMGSPIKIVDLARDLIQLSGLEPDVDIEIEFTGLRPGEKLFEELSLADESTGKTKHPKIYTGRLMPHASKDVDRWIDRLRQLSAAEADAEQIRAALREIVPEYRLSQPERSAPRPTTRRDL